ncbi:MAG: universal stress protein [Gammaproteobacteria bacterium]|jgi:nucleotide-binding universal stress UspA family protein
MKLLVAVDFSASLQPVIEAAEKMGKAHNAKIWLLHVVEPNPELAGFQAASQQVRDYVARKFHQEHRQLQDIAAGLRESGMDCSAHLVEGLTVETILDEAKKFAADNIMVGSHGKGAVTRLLVGGTSEGLLKRSPVPVIVVPTHGRS